VNTTWAVRIERLRTRLCVGVHADELAPQPVWVTVRLRGVATASPTALSECMDYEPLCRWVTETWPRAPHTPLLETRINELLAFVFDLDPRVQEVHAGLTKQRMSRQAVSVGVERCVSRPEFEAQRRHLKERTYDGRLPA
jgi:dihydroneopterin aldolase